MTQFSGETGEGLAAARAVLSDRDRALRDADDELNGVLAAAFRVAVESIRRIEAVQSEIEGVAQNSGLDAHTGARLLLERHRELINTVTTARDSAAAKSIELQRLSAIYSGLAGVSNG